MGLVIHDRFSTIFYKQDNFCNFLFAFLKRGLLLKKKGSKFFMFRVEPFSEGMQSNSDKAASNESVSLLVQ